MRRRTFLTAGGASLLCAPAVAADKAARTFRIIRDGDDIGTHSIDAVRGPNGFEAAIDIRIAVKVLGITAYRYEMTNREVWAGGRIVSLDSTVNDDGEADFARAAPSGQGLEVTGSRFSGPVSADAVTTSYFTQAFLDRRPWLSTQSGAPLQIEIGKDAARPGWWQVKGELTTDLGYSDGEWTGCEFDAGGELARYEIASQIGKIAPLWQSA